MFRTRQRAAALAAALLSGCGGGGGTGGVVPPAGTRDPVMPSTSVREAVLQPVPRNAPSITITEYSNRSHVANGGITLTSKGTVWFTALDSSQQAQIVEMKGTDERGVAIPVLPSAPNGMNAENMLVSTPNGRVWDDIATYGDPNGPGGQPLEDDRLVFAVDGAATVQPADGIDTADAGTAGVAGLTTDAHGNVWFAAPASIFYPGSELGSVPESAQDSSSVTRFFVNPQLTGGIAVMPNGEIWIAGLYALPDYHLAIGRVAPDGNLLGTLSVPGAYQNVTQAVVGGDGAYWYTDGTTISRADASGTTATYTVPATDPGIAGMALGGDGAVWFTESGAGKIGRITSNGTITEYALPSSAAHPIQIVGPKTPGCGYAQLWVAEAGTGAVAKLTITP